MTRKCPSCFLSFADRFLYIWEQAWGAGSSDACKWNKMDEF